MSVDTLAPTLEVDERRDAASPRARVIPAVRPRRWLLPRALLLADFVGLSGAFTLATVGSGRAGLVLFLVTLPGWFVTSKLHGLYERDATRADHSTVDELVGVFHVVTIGVWTIVAAALATGLARPDLGNLIGFGALAFAFVTVARGCARAVCRRTGSYAQRTIIVGAGDIGQLVARKLSKHPEYGLEVVGFVDSDPKRRRSDLDSLTVLGEPDQLGALVQRFEVERVVVAFSNDSAEQTVQLVRDLADLDVHVDVVPRLFDVFGPNVTVHSVEGLALVALPLAQRPTRPSRVLKRTFDIVVSAAALLLAAPVMLCIAWRVKLDSPGPVFFRQVRLGVGMREFTALKFRTMKAGTSQDEHRRYIRESAASAVGTNTNGLFKLERKDAITSSGQWLRKTSLDELPQLINVLRGDMSLVGPRPCIPYETEMFKPHHFQRFLVPAGITGLWQVTARANSTFGEALEMDVAYARAWSLGLDFRLLLRTPIQLVRQRTSTE